MPVIEVRRKDIKEWDFGSAIFRLLDRCHKLNPDVEDIAATIRVGKTQWLVRWEPRELTV